MRIPLALLVAALAIAGVGLLTDEPPDRLNAAQAVSELSPGFGPGDFDTAMRAADRTVSGKQTRMAGAPGEWLHQELLALALMERFRLGGGLEDMAQARVLLDSALDSAPEPSGPSLSSAALSLSLHRLDRAESALDRFDRGVTKFPRDEADAAAMRGDIAFQRGNLAGARAAYLQSGEHRTTMGITLRTANVDRWSGFVPRAHRVTQRAIAQETLTPHEFARAALQMASLSYANGDITRAGKWIDVADRGFPGFWLTRAYRAQQAALQGNSGDAIAQLTELAGKSPRPEVLGALAFYLRRAGRGEESRAQAARAAALWSRRMEQAPDAYRLHLAEHELALGDPARALTLLKQEYRRRPHGPVAALLARALVLRGQPKSALKVLDEIDARGWRSASLDLARADALYALGRADAAEGARDRAQELNPLALDERYLLIWFGHD